MTLSVGELLQNRYRIEGLLGRGGMGAVYRAYDLVLSTPVAIKENLNSASEAIRQFKLEAVLLASLRHGNLPRVTDHFVIGPRQYLVMDYVAGEDLKTRLERESMLPEAQVRAWAREICGALTYLHTRQPPVIHRDVKPANIKLTPDGHPILVDFGIAKQQNVAGGTSTGARSLTPGFAPPEQYGSRSTDARSDQYSLAATFYNLLTGVIPPDSLERTLGQSTLRPASEINPAVSPAVDQALEKALSLNPEDRFATVGEFLAALEGKIAATVVQRPAPTVRATQPTHPLPAPSAAPTAPPKPRRGVPWVLLVLLGLLVLIGAVGATLLGLLHPRAPMLAPTLPAPQATLALPSPPPSATAPGLDTEVPLALVPSQVPSPTAPATPTSTETPAPTLAPTPLGGSALIAFVSTRGGDGYYQVFTMDLTDGTVRQLTTDPGNKDHPRWSPDGKSILFEAEIGKNKQRDLFLMKADGTELTNLTNNPADDYSPAWNPHDNRIAFVSRRVGAVEQIFIMTPDGTGLVDISRLHKSQPEEWDPAWSADGRYLFFVHVLNGAVRIWRWDTLAPDQAPGLVTMLNETSDYAEAEPALSPRGDLMAYARFTNPGKEICVASTDLENRKPCDSPLTNKVGNGNPSWSPDGRMIVFTSIRDAGNEEIYLMTVTGAAQHNLTQSPARDKDPDWQPFPNP